MKGRIGSAGVSANKDLVTVGGLLLLAAVTPTVCFLWFMLQAVDNERLVVRQRLTDTYRSQLDRLAEKYDLAWHGWDVKPQWRDGRIVLDAKGQPSPPLRGNPRLTPLFEKDPEWEKAQFIETVERDFITAASAYSSIGESATEVSKSAMALRSQARCFALAGDKARAFRILREKFLGEQYKDAIDESGRLIRPDALLYAVKLVEGASIAGINYRISILEAPMIYELRESGRSQRRARSRFEEVLFRLQDLIPQSKSMPLSQRLYLIEALEHLLPYGYYFSIPSERLAVTYLETVEHIATTNRLAPSHLPGVWQLYSAENGTLILYREETILSKFRDFLKDNSYILDSNTEIELVPPSLQANRESPFLERNASPLMPGWRIALSLTGPDPFAAAAKNRIAALWWLGSGIATVTLILFFLIARVLTRQMKLTRLKNDLIANVSHELKTPVSSIRLLTDTLLEGKVPAGKETHEYLETISRENRRLSSLIDNFLTFSRMERDKHAFNFEDLDPAEIVASAAVAFQDRAKGPYCRFAFGCSPDLPAIQGDRDALVTVLLNLLDNAFKYSGERKTITLKGYGADGKVCFGVADNGIGIPRRARKKIFERFYQVDRSLSRETGGTGLGLAIVKFIVEAHGGDVAVLDNEGGGCVFIVKIPMEVLRGVETPR